MEYRVLGPLEIRTDDGVAIAIGTDRRAALLAGLLARHGQVVSTDALVEMLWGEEPPARPSNAVQVLVSRIRSAVRDAGGTIDDLKTQAPGYLLDAGASRLDSRDFEKAMDLAADAPPEEAARILEGALSLWRGTAYAGHADDEVAHLESIRLEEMRRTATVRLGGALTAAGRPDDAIVVLELFVDANPLHEGARGELMRALYAQGRHPEALRSYNDYREVLAEELGLEPSGALRQLEVDILRHELTSTGSPAGAPMAAPGGVASGFASMTVRYLQTAEGRVAWTSVGTGVRVVVPPAWITSLDVMAAGRDPRSSTVERLSQNVALTLYDRAGTGLTGGQVDDFTLESAATELESVMEATGGSGVLLAVSQAGPAAVTVAARRPDLVDRLVLFGTYACGPEVFTNTALASGIVDVARSHWGIGARILAGLFRPASSDAALDHLTAVLRDSAPAEVAVGYLAPMYGFDVTHLLDQVSCPALVIHYRGDKVIPFAGAMQLVDGLRNAQLLVLDGPYHLPDVTDLDRIADAVVAFVTSG